MNIEAKTEMCAPSGLGVDWHHIDWAKCHKQTRKLQARIVKATQEGRWGKVKVLQRLLTISFSGKAIAVTAFFIIISYFIHEFNALPVVKMLTYS